MRHALLASALLFGMCAHLRAHDVSTTPITWNREISRIVYERCASCHRPGGTSFSLMTYVDVQPRAVAVRDAVLSRRMPPWGAVSGFGDFRNNQALTAEQIELITDWVQDDTPKGNNARDAAAGAQVWAARGCHRPGGRSARRRHPHVERGDGTRWLASREGGGQHADCRGAS